MTKFFQLHESYFEPSNLSNGLFPFHSFYPSRWQVVVEIDLFYGIHNMFFKLLCNFKFASFLKGP